MSTAILILAAGKSSRMGEAKQLLKLGATSLIQRSIETALDASCEKVYCVLGAYYKTIKAHIANYPVEVIYNPNFELGLSSSIKAGLNVLSEQGIEAVMILLADQPGVTSAHLNALLKAYRSKPLHPVATSYKDGLGVPAVFPKNYFKPLKALSGDQGARVLLARTSPHISHIPFHDLTDIDTPEDYRNLLQNS
jgi:molybdenum cofactor cytidylyltransferase